MIVHPAITDFVKLCPGFEIQANGQEAVLGLCVDKYPRKENLKIAVQPVDPDFWIKVDINSRYGLGAVKTLEYLDRLGTRLEPLGVNVFHNPPRTVTLLLPTRGVLQAGRFIPSRMNDFLSAYNNLIYTAHTVRLVLHKSRRIRSGPWASAVSTDWMVDLTTVGHVFPCLRQ